MFSLLSLYEDACEDDHGYYSDGCECCDHFAVLPTIPVVSTIAFVVGYLYYPSLLTS